MKSKKSLLLIFLVSLVSFYLYSQDYYILNAYSGTPELLVPNGYLRIISEKVYIVLESDSYTITSDYTIQNDKSTQNIDIALPIYHESSDGDKTENEFIFLEIYENDRSIEYQKTEIANQDYYKANIQLEGNDNSKIRIKYQTKYSVADIQYAAIYHYGAHNSWNMIPNWKIEVTLENRANKWIHGVSLYSAYDIYNRNEISHFYFDENNNNVFGSELMLWISDNPVFLQNDWRIRNGRFTKLHLSLFTNAQLRLLRNFFYAVYGYSFKSEDLNNFYEQFNWYEKQNNFSEDQFTDLEKENIDNIITEEQSRK